MKQNIILVLSHKNSVRSEYFCDTLCSHKNIQKINFYSYDRIEKLFQIKSVRKDYLKNPKFFCENITHNHQLSFKPFLNHFIYFFIVEKPRNIIRSKKDLNYYCLRLRRIYEILYKVKNKFVLFDDQVYEKETYDKCFHFLGLENKVKARNIKIAEGKGFFEEEAEEFYEKYRYKITKKLLEANN